MNFTRKTLLFILVLFLLIKTSNNTFAQVNPTLGIGLSELTMKKGTIDVEVLTKIIIEKQKELTKEAMKRFLFDQFPQGNFATKYYIQNCLYTLMNEKNPQVIKKEILELTTNYSIALGLGAAYKMDASNHYLVDREIRFLMIDVNEGILKLRKNDTLNKGLDYKLMVDIVALSLSNSQQMKAKGFFKNPIDYQTGKYYTNLTDTRNETDPIAKKNKEKLEKDLNRLSNKITSQIDSYVKNFDVIKEFYSRSKSKKPEEIKNALLEMYNNEILDLYSSSGINTILEGSENQKDFSEAFKKYKESIITYNKEKSRNDNLNKIRSSLDTLIKILPEYKRSASHLNKSFQNLPQQYINLSTDSLATLSSAINDIQESRNPTTIRDTITNKISHYNSDKVKNLNLKKRTSEVFKILLFANQQLDTKIVIDTSKLKSDSNWKSEIEAISKNLNTDSEAELKKAKNNVNSNIILITHSIGFLDFYLKSLLNDLINKKNLNLAININSENGLKVTEEFSEYISKSYIQLKELAEKNTITIADVYNIENNIIPQLLKYSFYTEKTELKTTITNFRILSALLKAKIIVDANKDGDLKYDESLNSILTFVSNLDKLDKAETYQSVIDLIQENNENVAKCLTDDFKPIYTLFINGIKKYIVLNTNEQYVEVDVVSFLNDLQQYYNKENKSWFSLYFTLGISENFFLKKTTLPGTSNSISNVGLASEKIGAQFTFYTFGKQDAFKNIIKDKVYTNYKNPFINKMYAIIYASGLLYTLANTTTNENFDFPHVGAGGGFRFYNALDVNFSYALPFIDGQNFGKNGFISIGLDVPLGEYLERLGEK